MILWVRLYGHTVKDASFRSMTARKKQNIQWRQRTRMTESRLTQDTLGSALRLYSPQRCVVSFNGGKDADVRVDDDDYNNSD